MITERIKEIQSKTAFPDSISVQQALLQVWNECEQGKEMPTQEEIDEAVDKYSFVVPYNGTNDFYDKELAKHFKAGIDWVINKTKTQHP